MSRLFKIIVSLSALGAICGFAYYQQQQGPSGTFLQASKKNETDDEAFQKYIPKFKKNYKDKSEMAKRKKEFQRNLDFIKKHNATKAGYSLDLNEYSDLTQDEFKKILTYKPISGKRKRSNDTASNSTTNTTTNAFDWRQFGAVSSVKNQGSCGSCYAFASAGALEGLYKIKGGSLVDFSAQQLVDCSGSFGNLGCNGGNMEYCFNYYKSYKAQNQSSYPYTGVKSSTCNYKAASGLVNTLGYGYATQNDPTSIINALKIQPLTVAVAADKSDFQLYSSGILSGSTCGTALNHAVLLVGYGSDSTGKPYWIVKNSWGTSWGESGYIRILRDTSAGGAGICGINQYVVYPLMA